MTIKKIMLLIGLSMLFAGCSTSGNYSDTMQTTTPTKMGVRYLLGRGVQQNNEKAFFYFSQGAKENDVYAQNELAYMYAAGKGTSRDYNKALFWYQQAADHDLASAQYNLGLMYLHGMGTEVNKALARKWFQKSANHGFEPAKQALTQT